MNSERPLSAAAFGDTLPRCTGYPDCDGDLVGIAHSDKCPLFGKVKTTRNEFATAYAAYLLRELEREQRESETTANGGAVAHAVELFRRRVLGEKA